MQLWKLFTIFSAFVQNFRFMLQRNMHLSGLTPTSATFARFIFGAPIAFLFLTFLLINLDYQLPRSQPKFFYFSLIGGLSQIFATILTIKLFAKRNFSIGIIFTKTEIIQTAIVGFIFLGEIISLYSALAILISFIGIICLSKPKTNLLISPGRHYFNQTTLFGLGAGAFFGISSVGYRGASLSLLEGDFIIRAATTLAFVTIFQASIMTIWFIFKNRNDALKTLKLWRISGLVGLTGVLGSYAWFMAFTLQNAAYVRALGQIELVFTFLGSYFFFKERHTKTEIFGIALIILSIFILLKMF
jgi:drug/metabolite transporter (DMT)-like permease